MIVNREHTRWNWNPSVSQSQGKYIHVVGVSHDHDSIGTESLLSLKSTASSAAWVRRCGLTEYFNLRADKMALCSFEESLKY